MVSIIRHRKLTRWPTFWWDIDISGHFCSSVSSLIKAITYLWSEFSDWIPRQCKKTCLNEDMSFPCTERNGIYCFETHKILRKTSGSDRVTLRYLLTPKWRFEDYRYDGRDDRDYLLIHKNHRTLLAAYLLLSNTTCVSVPIWNRIVGGLPI